MELAHSPGKRSGACLVSQVARSALTVDQLLEEGWDVFIDVCDRLECVFAWFLSFLLDQNLDFVVDFH